MEFATTWEEISKADGPLSPRHVVRSGILSALALVSRPPRGPVLRILYCHHVFDDQIAAFDAKVAYLARIGDFLTIDEVLEVVSGARILDRPAFHISFDDGFKNIVTNALPVLMAHGAPATFFVPTDLIECDDERLEDYCRNVVHYPKVIATTTWDALADAARQGLTIASHTRNYARLSEISASAARLEDEIAGSKRIIEERLGAPCRYISWPYGTVGDTDGTVTDCIRRSGYDACFGAFRGAVPNGRSDPFSIPRHHFETNWPASHFRFFAHGGWEKS